MRLSLFIARRYLFSKKKQNAINIISAISVVGVMIGTTALIVILSVFNGMDLFLQKSMDSMTPDIVISPLKGKFVVFDSLVYERLAANPAIAYWEPVIEENALLKYGQELKPVTVKGVTASFQENTKFDSNMVQGVYSLKSGDIYTAVIGYGIAAELRMGLHFMTPMILYYPDRKASSMNAALHSQYLFPAGFFSSQQDIEGKFVLTDIDFARKLFLLEENQISKIELNLKKGENREEVKAHLAETIGPKYKVQDKYELNRSYYAMMKSEKLTVFLILLFIFLIASFNIVGSISMLILDKKEDLGIYRALGMPRRNIVSIFRTEGNLITMLGALIGLGIGILICFLQEKYGLIKFGDGGYIIEAYPVKLVAADIVWIMIAVLLIGYFASLLPVRYLVRRLIQ